MLARSDSEKTGFLAQFVMGWVCQPSGSSPRGYKLGSRHDGSYMKFSRGRWKAGGLRGESLVLWVHEVGGTYVDNI